MIPIDTANKDLLAIVEDSCWQMLSEAVSDRKHPMRTVTIGYVSNGMPQIRTVVLRKVEKKRRKLYFHTDIRSEKVSSIGSHNQLTWLAYDKDLRVQLILGGKTIIHHNNALTEQQWKRTQHSSRRCYLLTPGPGKPYTEDVKLLEEKLKNFSYSIEESEKGYENFAVVETTVDQMDWYHTFHLGNQRAHFIYENNNIKSAEWLTP